MGTRHIIMLVNDKGEIKVAQYGQWDGYPSGQGIGVLDFAKKHTEYPKEFERVHFFTKKEIDEYNNFLKEIGSPKGICNMNQAQQVNIKYPQLSRDHGADILEFIMADKRDSIVLQDSFDFGFSPLHCEWAYVIDYQRRTLEVYEGCMSKNSTVLGRWEKVPERIIKEHNSNPFESKYTDGISLKNTYLLDDLPNPETFKKDNEGTEEKEDVDL